MKKLLIGMMAGVLCFSGVAFADMKVGVIDAQAIMAKMPEAQKLNDSMTKEFKPRQDSLKAMNDKLQSNQAKFTRDNAVMSSKDRDALQAKIQKGQVELQTQAQQYQADLTKARNESLQQLFNKIQAAVDQVAKKDQLDLVLEKQAAPYFNSQLDITDEVLKALS